MGGGLSPIKLRLAGHVYGTDDFENTPYPLAGANVKVTLLADTTCSAGGATSQDGRTTCIVGLRKKLGEEKRVRVDISYIGMEKFSREFTIDSEPETRELPGLTTVTYNLQIDSLVLRSRPVTTEEAVIIGELKKMYQSGDTIIFNTDAYEMPTGSVLLELVRRLPGLQYDGKRLTYFGRSIDEIRLNGESFFAHDLSVALKNMPVDKLKQFRVYETEKDTLNANAEKKLVADMITKQPVTNMNFGNAEAAVYSVKEKYSLTASLSHWAPPSKGGSEWSVNVFGRDYPDLLHQRKRMVDDRLDAHLKSKLGGISYTLTPNYDYRHEETKQSALNAAYMPDYTEYTRNEAFSRTVSNTFGGDFGFSGSLNRTFRWEMNAKLNYTDTRSRNRRTSETYSDNPYADDSHNLLDATTLDSLSINNTHQQSTARSWNKKADWRGTLVHDFSERKGQVGLRSSFNLNNSHQRTLDETFTHFTRLAASNDYLREMVTPTKNTNFSVGIFFNRQLGQHHSLSLSYDFRYARNKTSEDYYDQSGDTCLMIDSLTYRTLSKDFTHDIAAMLTLNFAHSVLKLGMGVAPERKTLDTDMRDGQAQDTAYNSVIYSPSVSFSLNPVLNSPFSISYSGFNNMASASQLMPTLNMDDPLCVQLGNPRLKEQFTHKFKFSSSPIAHLSIHSNFNIYENLVAMKTDYDALTGVRRIMPDNVNGNWDCNSGISYSNVFDHFTLSADVSHSYLHQVRYVESGSEEVRKGTTQAHGFQAQLSLRYSNVRLYGSFLSNYALAARRNDFLHSSTTAHNWKNQLNATYNLTKYFSVSSDMTLDLRRGYEMKSSNITRLYWNAMLAYRCLRSRQGTLSLTADDLLHQRRSCTALSSDTGWSEQRLYTDLHYFELKFSYRFSSL